MVSTAFLHFVCNEVRPFILFYVGGAGLLIGTATFIANTKLGVAQIPAKGGPSVDDLNNCVYKDVRAAMMTLKATYHGVCSIIDPNPWGYLFVSASIVFLLVASALISHMFHVAYFIKYQPAPGKPPKDLCYTHGHYLSYTYTMRAKRWYQYSCNLLILYSALAVMYIFMLGLNSHYWLDFLSWQAQSLLLTIVGAAGFRTPVETAFNMHTHEFHHLHFIRGKWDLLLQTNETFAKQLEQAVYHAKFGNTEFLAGMVDLEKSGLGSWDEVLHILDPCHEDANQVDAMKATAGEPNSIMHPLLAGCMEGCLGVSE